MEITSASLAYTVLRELIAHDTEELWTLALGPKKTLLQSKMIFRGTVDACLVHPRDIFRFAVLENASSIIIAHSHPSGDLTPSHEDLLFTRRLVRGAALMQVPVLDHLIITKTGYSSMAHQNWCRFPESLRQYI